MKQMEETSSYSGKKLKEIRINRGIKIEEIVESTKVTKDHLINIEEENFSEIPARIYLKGFIISYADCLGLDSNKVVEDILKNLDRQSESQYS